MAEWISTTIGEQVTLQRGFDITRVAQRQGLIPVVSSGGIGSFHDEAAAQGPGVVLGRKGVVGSVWYVQEDYWPHDTTLWVRDFHGNDPRFVYYFFRWFAPRLESLDVGSANPTLNRNHVHPTPVRWPFLDEQHRIAGILGALDDKIQLNRRMGKTLEATARALFRSWFVDFNDGTRDPDAWPQGTLLDLATLTPESVSAHDLPETVQYVDLAGAKDGRIETITAYPRSAAPSRAQRVLRPGDTIVGTVRPGNRSFAHVPRDGLIGSTGFAHLRPVNPRDAAFVYLTATADVNIDRLAHLADGAAYPAVRPGVVGATQAVLPDPGTLERFSLVATPLLARATQAGAESEMLIALRDALLPRLLAG